MSLEQKIEEILRNQKEILEKQGGHDACLDGIMRFLDENLPKKQEVQNVKAPAKSAGEIQTWDDTKIPWKQANGRNGPFDWVRDETNEEYHKMWKWVNNNLKTHWAFRENKTYWFMPDGSVARKPRA